MTFFRISETMSEESTPRDNLNATMPTLSSLFSTLAIAETESKTDSPAETTISVSFEEGPDEEPQTEEESTTAYSEDFESDHLPNETTREYQSEGSSAESGSEESGSEEEESEDESEIDEESTQEDSKFEKVEEEEKTPEKEVQSVPIPETQSPSVIEVTPTKQIEQSAPEPSNTSPQKNIGLSLNIKYEIQSSVIDSI